MHSMRTKLTVLVLLASASCMMNTVVGNFLDAVPSSVEASNALPAPIHLERRNYKVTISFSAVPANSEHAGLLWGSFDPEQDELRVSRIVITHAGEDVHVPLSVYADLGRPHDFEAKLVPTRSGLMKLHIDAGDAGTSYQCVIEFDQKSVAMRKVYHGEFPDESLEETVYTSEVWDY